MLFTSLSLQASEKLKFYLEGNYTHGLGSFAAFDVPAPEIEDTSLISPDNPTTKSDYDFSGIGQYSDLNYGQLEGTFGFNFGFAEDRSVFGAVSYLDLQDDASYVYGDLDGTLMTYSTGLKVGF